MALSLKAHFTEWCRKQGEREYEYGDIFGCALCQFLNANGYTKRAVVGGQSWRDDGGDARHDLDFQLGEALVQHPRTFSALADRLAA